MGAFSLIVVINLLNRVMTETPALPAKSFSWAGFFADAGLPPSVCANYAVLFIDNRMKRSMIPDITKEILHELGIRAVGDVIAILRHTKSNNADSSSSKLKRSSQAKSVDRSEKKKDLDRTQEKVPTFTSKELKNTGSGKQKDPERSKSRRESVSSRQSIGTDYIKRTNQRMQKEPKVGSSKGNASSSKLSSSGSKSRRKETKSSASHASSHEKGTLKKRRVSKTSDVELSDSESETESIRREKLTKKRKVVMEDVPMAAHLKNARSSKAPKNIRSKDQYTKIKAEPVTPPRETSEESFRSISVSKSDSENESTSSPQLSRLNYLAEKYRIEKPKVKLEPDTDAAESLDGSICKIESAKVQLVMREPMTQFIRMIGPTPDFNSKREQEVQWQTQVKIEAEMDQEIRDALSKGRKTLDRSRMDGGLDYLGSFRTDYQDEARPGTLVSDQRETKLLNRLGPKPEIKEEPKMNGSLTILNETGERKTTSLTEHDRTVIRLNKYDSVYKRLGPEQKVPLQPPTVGVLGLDSPRKVSSMPSPSERDIKDEIPEHDRSCVIYDRRALKRRLPKRSQTDLRDMLQCKGGFIPSEEEESSSRREPGPMSKRLVMSASDLRGRLSRKKSPVYYRGGRRSNEERSRLSNLRTVQDVRSQGVSGARLLLDRTVKDVIESRHSEERW